MTENNEINIKNTARVARKHATGLIFSNIFGYFIWSIIYGVVIYFGVQYILDNYGYTPSLVWLGGVVLYLAILALTFLLRIRAVYSGFKGAALDAAEEVLSSSDHKAAKASARTFKIIRWFTG
ncbi:MAG: hypothetical protein ACRBBN_08080 [Methyloligellaceae bacterium]